MLSGALLELMHMFRSWALVVQGERNSHVAEAEERNGASLTELVKLSVERKVSWKVFV